MTVTLEHALSYAARGLRLLPLHSPVQRVGGMACSCGKKDCTSPAKHPVGSLVPHGLKDATADTAILEQWFGDKARNIGIATGTVSGIVALDIDPRHDGDASLAALEKQHGAIPPTWRFLTGGGGEHILFRHPGGHVANSANKTGQGIDVRGDGGYIVAPPSQHTSGRPYAVSVDHDPDTVPLADVPAWLLPMIQKITPAPVKAIPPEEWRQQVRRTVAEGERNSVIARLAGHLLRNRIDPWVAAELLTAWNTARCQPPMPEAEVLATIRSIARREIARRKGEHAA